MNRKLLILDEKKYPIAWRFNSEDCSLSFDEKREIVFLDEEGSEILWNMVFPFNHLMKMDSSFFSVIEKNKLDFECPKESSLFFKNKLIDISFVFFFWGKRASAIAPVDVFVKSWSDFFYPSDETSVVLIANRKKMIFSYEETFFYADILE
ncbi:MULTISPECIES: hypothetical protein [unclassified Brenneria]|uniref:DUF2947 family protein n=1 Tax=unclassified Brenneria TaxID=2634434 RepID=UPI0029C1A471|nr:MULTISPECIES: hypothetical protein [unclassified Brenneria]MDX5631126.1 hypothetical protein [Brenneria sp. L3-3Z]MDX5698199.1 hypothetical protein [Brenneria sp. L4-2C]